MDTPAASDLAGRKENEMRRIFAWVIGIAAIAAGSGWPAARSYVVETTVPQAQACPAPDTWNLSSASPTQLQWSTSLASAQQVLTVAPLGSADQLTEIQSVIQTALNAWTGVDSTSANPNFVPGVVGAIGTTSTVDACTADDGSGADGVNTICFNQSSADFTIGVLAFTRTITANSPGVSLGASGPSAFAGQLLDSDTLFNNTDQVNFATPGVISTPQGVGSYDLASLLTHELGHYFGLDHSAVRRAIMFPFAPPPGTMIGTLPTAAAPDSQLSDDDRTGMRVLYPNPAETLYLGTITGHVIPANPFALAIFPPTAAGQSVTGIFGTQVVAVDADTGATVAATLGGWSCNNSNPVVAFDGSYRIDRLPLGRNYIIYAEPLDGLATGQSFYETSNGLCAASQQNPCTPPAVNTNFTTRIKPQ
jgi:Matrixin